MADPVRVHSRSLANDSERYVKPIGNQVLVELAPHEQTFGKIIAISGDHSVDVQISRVLSVGDKAKADTTQGRVKANDKVLSVRVVNKRVDDIDMRTSTEQRIGFIPDEHVLAVLTETEILPCNDCVLVEAHGDRRQYGKIELLGADSLDVHSSKILATGPQVTQLEVGEFAIHPRRFGVEIDSYEIRKKYGGNLKIIREKSVLGAGDDKETEGKMFPEIIPTKKLF